VDRI